MLYIPASYRRQESKQSEKKQTFSCVNRQGESSWPVSLWKLKPNHLYQFEYKTWNETKWWNKDIRFEMQLKSNYSSSAHTPIRNPMAESTFVAHLSSAIGSTALRSHDHVLHKYSGSMFLLLLRIRDEVKWRVAVNDNIVVGNIVRRVDSLRRLIVFIMMFLRCELESLYIFLVHSLIFLI